MARHRGPKVRLGLLREAKLSAENFARFNCDEEQGSPASSVVTGVGSHLRDPIPKLGKLRAYYRLVGNLLSEAQCPASLSSVPATTCRSVPCATVIVAVQ